MLVATSALARGPPPVLSVHFFDVGQGDAALIRAPGGKSVLIDAGPPEAGEPLARKVKSLVRGPIDLVVLSHPHLDHLGGFIPTLRATGLVAYLEPGFDHPSSAYERLLSFLATKKPVEVTTAADAPGALRVIDLGEGARLRVLWPRVGPSPEFKPVEPLLAGTRSDANANSVVARLEFGSTSFLFTGDAEAETEQLLVRRDLLQPTTVLKVAHHGSEYSTTPAFLSRVRPKAAVISCGKGNDYGHPSPIILRRLAVVGAEVFRTDLGSDVVAVSDGERVTLSSSEPNRTHVALGVQPAKASHVPPAKYVGSRHTRLFHRIDCPSARRIDEKNRVEFVERSDALRTRQPAKDCAP